MKEKITETLQKLVYLFIILVVYLAVKIFFKLRVEGESNIPENTDNVLITSSHTSYWDPPLIGLIFGPIRQVHFIARKGLLSNPVFRFPVKWYSATIDRDNFGKEDLKKMLTAFRKKGLLCIFPEGTTSDGSPPKSGTVRLAEKTNRIFLPVKIEVERSPLEYPFFSTPARLVIGSPLDLQELKDATRKSNVVKHGNDDEPDYQDLSLVLMEKINEL
jgi:1-acyl-sn-glycerol-3-phosphate acyltransferase